MYSFRTENLYGDTSLKSGVVSNQDHVLEWLLEPDNPPVRYLTLTNLLGKPATDKDVRRTSASFKDYEVTQHILQRVDDVLQDKHYYRKYTGAYWQLIFLGQLHASKDDRSVAQLAESILAEQGWIPKDWGQCLTANILTALTRLGYESHPIVRQQRETLARRLNEENGLQCIAMDYSLMSRCYMALPKLLLCFTQVKPKKRSPAIKKAIRFLVNTLVENEVYVYVPGNQARWQEILKNRPRGPNPRKNPVVIQWIAEEREIFLNEHGLGDRAPKAGWLKFGYPPHYNSDVLEAMYALALAETRYTPRLKKPLQVIQDKQTKDGQWKLEFSLNGKMIANVEKKGKPSKWLTYYALYVLRHFKH